MNIQPNIRDYNWFPFSSEPVIKSFLLKDFSSPSFLFPEDAFDQKWHIVFSAKNKIFHYCSKSGLSFQKEKILSFSGSDPFLFKNHGKYYIIYVCNEYKDIYLHSQRFLISKENFKQKNNIVIRESNDLKKWSRPKVLLSFNNQRLGSPSIIRLDNSSFKLFFSFDFLKVSDYSFPKNIQYANSDKLYGPYFIERGGPVLFSVGMNYSNMAIGNISLRRSEEDYLALNTSLFYSPKDESFKSAVRILISKDGINWNFNKIILKSDNADSLIKNIHFKYRFSERTYYAYYATYNGIYLLLAKKSNV